MIKFPLKIH